MTDTLRALAKELCGILTRSPELLREMDTRIAVAIGAPKHVTIGDGVIIEQRQIPYVLPHYTTSLDAKLPGEDIEKVERLSDGGFVARDARNPLHYCPGHTEPLARRAAALLAMAQEKENA